MKPILLITFIFTTLSSCRSQENFHQEYTDQVGEISFDEKIDDPAFKEPDSLILFFEPIYRGPKPAIVKYFKSNYKVEGFENANGYITIRFFINSNGKAGKFRVQTMDFELKPKEFNPNLCVQLLKLTKGLPGWEPLEFKDKTYGYYSYLNFKIMNGVLKEITP